MQAKYVPCYTEQTAILLNTDIVDLVALVPENWGLYDVQSTQPAGEAIAVYSCETDDCDEKVTFSSLTGLKEH